MRAGGKFVAVERGLFPRCPSSACYGNWRSCTGRSKRSPRRTSNHAQEHNPERLAERICRCLDLKAADNAEGLTELLREALLDVREAAIASGKAMCLEIAEDEAERSRRVGATTAQQTAMTIAARIRKRHVEV
jgi:hypothetical protein